MPEPMPLDPQTLRAPLPATTLLPDVFRRIRAAREIIKAGASTVGLPTGFPTIDREMSGLQEGLHVVGAQPGAGKTTFGISIARHAAKQGLPTVFVTFDEGADRLSLKTLCSLAGVPAARVAGGLMDPAPLETAASTHHEVLSKISFIQGDSTLSPTEAMAGLEDRLAQHRARIGLMVVDYIQPWAAAWRGAGMEYRQAVGALVVELRQAALRCHCPILLISAQNRAAQGEAKMSSLRETSDLEYSADSIIFLTADNNRLASPPRKAVTATISKNRYGPPDLQIPLWLDGSAGTLVEAAEDGQFR
jgi:replicative DNA helicase